MFEKVQNNRFLKIIILFLCSLFIAGAALNDGWTGWFWGLPFLYVFYRFLPCAYRTRIVVVLVLGVCMVLIAYVKGMSSLVYPAIGSKVTVLQDIPIVQFGNKLPQYDMNPDFDYDKGCVGCGSNSRYTVPAGTIYTVKDVTAYSPDFGLAHEYILDDGTGPIKVSTSAFNDSKVPLCYRVQGIICEYGVDPMRREFRLLASLMYYPVLPLFVVTFVTGSLSFILQ